MEQERLNRFLARAGVASRRSSDRLIQTGRVEVNGQVVTHPGMRVNPDLDSICCDGKQVRPADVHTYVLLNKPDGYLVSAGDPHHERTVFDLMRGVRARVFPVGRLDLDTQGVLLLTDDGDLSFRLTHPRFGIEKVYRAHVRGCPDEDVLQRLREGVMLEDGFTAPAGVRLVRREGDHAVLELTLREGRKRQVKLMCAAVGHRVSRLVRTAFAGLTAQGLDIGQWRPLTEAEVSALKRRVGL